MVANLNYNLIATGKNYQTILDDVDKAIRFLRVNSGNFVFDNKKFALYGVSAGGHIALLYGYKNPKDINAIISLCGPTNINDAHFKKIVDSAWMSPRILPLLIGKSFELNSPETKSCSPVDNISDVPALFTWD